MLNLPEAYNNSGEFILRRQLRGLVPLTIKQCLDAAPIGTDGELGIDGYEVKQLTIVAAVELVAQQATNHIYFLEDGTGRIEARVWIDPSTTSIAGHVAQGALP